MENLKETQNTEITPKSNYGVSPSVTRAPESACDDHGRDSASDKIIASAMSAKEEDKEVKLLECSPTDKKKKKKSRKKKKSAGSGGNVTSVAPDEEADPNDPSLSNIGKLTLEKEGENIEETLESKSPNKRKKKKKGKKTESISSASPEPPCSGDDVNGLTGYELQTDDKQVNEAEMSAGAVADVTPQPDIKKGRDNENSDVSDKPHDTDEVPSTEKEGSDVMDSVKETYKESKNGSNLSLVENTEMTKTRKEDLCMSGEDENDSVDVASFDRNLDTPAPVAFSTQPKVEDLESDAEDNSSSTLGCEG